MRYLIIIIALLVSKATLASDPVYIDVRTWAEHQVDSIEGDAQIHVSDIVEGVQSKFPDKSTVIRVYCAKGGRAQTAMERLQAAGYSDVKNLGGIGEARIARSIPDEE